ncbi:siderophore esteras-like protein IroE-like protein [Coniella lustricola]|uniref:Siderophore esteras-like protein IroE-like protein n=1 Tax=Coniella lustricola TaxID=2025994 RepID=A0A2T2ZTS1_9PEZI|nr:siderophore esteras-like protein IroE-like protein [Coniella lustricola]
MMSLSNYSWSFTPLVSSFPPTVLPNVAFWNVTNESDLNYQIQVSWPLEWPSVPEEANDTALTMFILDGNALGMTGTEAWRRRDPVVVDQPSGIVVSIGYPLVDSVYGAQRSIDYQPVTPGSSPPAVPGTPQGADDFIDFIEHELRPFLREVLFPRVQFGREAVYGHSFGGLFVVYALLRRPDLFDTFLAASPDLTYDDWYILNHMYWLAEAGSRRKENGTSTSPAVRVSYGSLEQYPRRKRTETYDEYVARIQYLKSLGVVYSMGDDCNSLWEYLNASPQVRNAEIKEYVGSDHSSVGAVALTDGVSYFVNW